MLTKEPGKDWTVAMQAASDWKPQILPILELYVDRVPGSTIEEKEFSLSWHYRKADPELSSLRSKELMDHLMHITTNLNLQVLPGNKVVELRNAGINKGSAAANWLARDHYDFVLAVGYDWMDEDLFRGLPPEAHTIKVGLGRQSSARWNVRSHNEIVQLLRELARIGAPVSGVFPNRP
jgi:trehalose 6-phosphate synthase/phosphatase